MFEVSVYYNENVMAMIRGFNSEDKLHRVAANLHYTQDNAYQCATAVFTDMQECENKPLLRSMSVGDVLCVRYCLGDGMCTTGIWLACARQGFTLIDQPRYIR